MIKNKIFAFVYMTLSLYAVNISAAESEQKNPYLCDTDNEDTVTFVPPKGWCLADASSLPKTVKVMVVGKGAYAYPPSINLAVEPDKRTLKQFMKAVKAMNEAQDFEWKDLGIIQTASGPASLSQVDIQTEWGNRRTMNVILLKNEKVYILTACALKDEFPKFYKEFFDSMKSLKVDNK